MGVPGESAAGGAWGSTEDPKSEEGVAARFRESWDWNEGCWGLGGARTEGESDASSDAP